jgi:hypothetical protein
MVCRTSKAPRPPKTGWTGNVVGERDETLDCLFSFLDHLISLCLSWSTPILARVGVFLSGDLFPLSCEYMCHCRGCHASLLPCLLRADRQLDENNTIVLKLMECLIQRISKQNCRIFYTTQYRVNDQYNIYSNSTKNSAFS